MPQVLYMFYSMGAINQIYGMLFIGFFVIILWQWFRVGRTYINAFTSQSMCALVGFGLFYFGIGEHTLQSFLYYFVCPVLAFMAGWITVEATEKKPEAVIKSSVYFMLIGFAVHALLNYASNIGHFRWQLTDFFTGEFAGATGSGCINTFIFSLTMYFLTLENNLLLKTVGIISSAIAFLYALLLGTRAQFLILFIVSVLFLFFYFNEVYGRSAIIRLAIIVSFLVGLFFLSYDQNILNVRTYIDTSNLIERYQYGATLESADDYRISSIISGFDLLFDYPLGGLKDTKYYHNMWLDIGRVAGIIPFICMIVYSIVINVHLIRIVNFKKLDVGFRYMIFCLYLGVQMNFFVEPVIEGVMWFFLTFTFLNGMVEFYYTQIFFLKHASLMESEEENR